MEQTMKRPLLVTMALTLLLVASIALTGCGKGNTSLVGSYKLAEIDTGSQKYTTEQIQELETQWGSPVATLDSSEDGTLVLNLFGDEIAGTWEKGDKYVMVYANGDELEVQPGDGYIALVSKSTHSYMIFIPHDGSTVTVPEENAEGKKKIVELAKSELVEKVSGVLIDNDYLTIDITGKGIDWAGWPCYFVTITSKVEQPIHILANSVTVGGTDVTAIIGHRDIEVGQIVETIISFDNEIVPSLDDLYNVRGTIATCTPETYEPITEDAFLVDANVTSKNETVLGVEIPSNESDNQENTSGDQQTDQNEEQTESQPEEEPKEELDEEAEQENPVQQLVAD